MSTAKGAEYFAPLDVLIGTLSSAHTAHQQDFVLSTHTANHICDL